jgi:hypothetical protein
MKRSLLFLSLVILIIATTGYSQNLHYASFQNDPRFDRPANPRPKRNPNAPIYRSDVIHEHISGNCRGPLTFTAQRVLFNSYKSEDVRDWNYGDIKSIELKDPVHLKVTIFAENGRDFNFVLRRPMSDRQLVAIEELLRVSKR